MHHYVAAKYALAQRSGAANVADSSLELGGLQLHDPSATVEQLQRELERERRLRQEAEEQLQKLRDSTSRVCGLM